MEFIIQPFKMKCFKIIFAGAMNKIPGNFSEIPGFPGGEIKFQENSRSSRFSRSLKNRVDKGHSSSHITIEFDIISKRAQMG